jgi:AcrR family transcriptional regulator
MVQQAVRPKVDKREAILQATLQVMAEFDFANAPMSLISKRSQASPGIIYHYFASKDDLEEAVYSRIYSKSLQAFQAEDDPQASLPLRYQHFWLTVYHYCFEHPLEVAFLDQYENSPTTRRPKNALPVENMSFDQFADYIAQPEVYDRLSPEEKALAGLVGELHAQNRIHNLPQVAFFEFAVYVPPAPGPPGSQQPLKIG